MTVHGLFICGAAINLFLLMGESLARSLPCLLPKCRISPTHVKSKRISNWEILGGRAKVIVRSRGHRFGQIRATSRCSRLCRMTCSRSRLWVAVLHGCGQDRLWLRFRRLLVQPGDALRFCLLMPQQQPSNNAKRMLQLVQSGRYARDSGEACSIRQMIGADGRRYRIDQHRIFVTGISAGGAIDVSHAGNLSRSVRRRREPSRGCRSALRPICAKP